MRLENFRHDAIACIRCSNCKWIDQNYTKSNRFSKICPINARFGFDAYSGGGMLTIARALIDGKLGYSPKLVDVAFKCTLCGACDIRCKRNLDIEVLQTLEGLRARLTEENWGPLEPHKAITQKIRESGNRYGIRNSKRLDWLPDGVVPAHKAEILYFVGCNSSFVKTEIACCTVKILQAAGIPFMVLPDERCCGHPVFTTGQEDVAREIMEHNIKAIQESGATTVLTSCAEGYHTLKVKYPRFLNKKTEEMNFRVVHISEYIHHLIKTTGFRFARPVNMKVTYHDPCHLGRLSEPWKPWDGVFEKFGISKPPREMRRGTFGVYESPREILKSILGLELIEMERVKEQAWCCGAGGGVRDALRDFALWTARERAEEARVTGAEAIVSCCPWCEENLRDAIGVNPRRMRIYDIVQLMAEAL